jgi:hypothetical protein
VQPLCRTYDPAVSLRGIYPKEMNLVSQRDICTFMFIRALFTIAKTWDQPSHPSIDEEIAEYTYNEILFGHVSE